MVDVENLKINKRLDVEGTNLRITEIGNQIWEYWFILQEKIWELTKLRAVRNIE